MSPQEELQALAQILEMVQDGLEPQGPSLTQLLHLLGEDVDSSITQVTQVLPAGVCRMCMSCWCHPSCGLLPVVKGKQNGLQ